MKPALLFTTGLCFFAWACSDGVASADDERGASGLVRSRAIGSLSDAEADAFCDWSLATQGGAGKKTDCGGGRSKVVHTKEECLDDVRTIRSFASCYAATVGEAEDCSVEEGRATCEKAPTCESLNARLDACAGDD
jgi:hypothetical protein